jgi:hypothetical protein
VPAEFQRVIDAVEDAVASRSACRGSTRTGMCDWVVMVGLAGERKPHPDRSTYAARPGHEPNHI